MADNVTVDGIQIEIEGSASGASTQIDAIISILKDLKRSLNGVSGKKAAQEIKDVGKAARKTGEEMSEAADETDDFADKQDKAKKKSKSFKDTLSDIAKVSSGTKSGISSIFTGIKNGDISGVLNGFSSLTSVITEGGAASSAAGAAAGGSAVGWGIAAVAVSGVVKVGAKAAKTLAKLTLNIGLLPIKKLTSDISVAVAKLKQFFNAISRIATYRLLRTALKEISEGFSTGVENAYYFASAVGNPLASSLDSIATNLLYVKNSIGAAVAPLINALAPAVEIVVDRFVALVNTANQFLSAFTGGGTWIKAVKYPQKYADGLDDATSSAKELKRTLLGFDEINPLNDVSDNGSGSGSKKSADYSSMFTTETVNSSIADFAKELKQMIEDGDWAGIGTTLADKLNSVVKTLDKKVKWDNVGGKITEWLGNITDAFNAFVDEFDGKAAGGLVGDAIMTAFNSIDVFLDDIDFDKLAGKITDFINGAFEKIDGKSIGQTINKVLVKSLNLATNVLNGVDKDAASEDITGFFKGLDITGIKNAFMETFSAVGSLAWEGIKAGLKGIGTDILNFILNNIKDTIADVLKVTPGLSWLGELIDSITIDIKSGVDTGLNTDNTVGETFGSTIHENVVDSFDAEGTGSTLHGGLGGKFDVKDETGKNFGSNIADNLTGEAGKESKFKDVIDKIKGFFSKDNTEENTGTGNELGARIGNNIAVGSKEKSAFQKAVDKIKGFFSKDKIEKDTGTGNELGARIGNNIAVGSQEKSGFQKAVDKIKGFFSKDKTKQTTGAGNELGLRIAKNIATQSTSEKILKT